MEDENTNATLIFGISSIETDLASCTEFYSNGKQNILKTIDNYLELLEKAKDTLILLRDSLSDDETDKIKLTSSLDGECLEIEGDEQIIDRFVAFGIAERNDESIYSEQKTDTDNSDSDTDTESEASDEKDSNNSDNDSDSDTSDSDKKNSDSESSVKSSDDSSDDSSDSD